MNNIYSKIIFLPCLFALISCQNEISLPSDSSEYNAEHSYDEISQWEIKWADIFNQCEEEYYVYFYSPTCSHCNLIKNTIIDYALEHEGMYFIHFNEDVITAIDIQNTIGASSVDDLAILGTPSLVEIKHHVVTNNMAGTTKILTFLGLDEPT